MAEIKFAKKAQSVEESHKLCEDAMLFKEEVMAEVEKMEKCKSNIEGMLKNRIAQDLKDLTHSLDEYMSTLMIDR